MYLLTILSNRIITQAYFSATLQGIDSFIPGTYPDYIGDIVYKNLTVTDMSGVEFLFDQFYDSRNLRFFHYYSNLLLRKDSHEWQSGKYRELPG